MGNSFIVEQVIEIVDLAGFPNMNETSTRFI